MKYRPEVDGLRAIAIIPVIMLHAGFQLFSGGFVGVDVFFVISGYLITTIILNEKEKGTFSLINFYERRARRILPALFLVMLTSLPFAWWFLLPSNMVGFSHSLIGVSTFSSNFFFWLDDTGYWGSVNELKPLLHTWSLAVEEQFYVLYPLFIMLIWKFRKRWILSSFILVAAISLILAQWGAYHRPEPTFFLLPTRGWELAVGACIAFYFLYRKQTNYTILNNKFIEETLSLVGLVMIGYAVFVFDETTPFPSIYTLIPTVGSGLIILFSSAQTAVGRMLGTKAFVVIGLISYSVYIWHQPLFAFSRNASLTDLSEPLRAVLAVLSFVLGYLSWRYIETPFRKKDKFSRKTIFTISITGIVFFIGVGLIGSYSEGFPSRFKMKQSVLDSFVLNTIRSSCDIEVDPSEPMADFCTLGATTSDNQIEFAVFGDSHSDALLPAFDSAARSINVSYVHASLYGCPPLLGLNVVMAKLDEGVCENFTSREFEFVKNNHIKNVFLVARWALYTDGRYYEKDMDEYFLVDKSSTALTKESSRAVFERGLRNTIDAYQSIGVNVYIVEQIPQQTIVPNKLYYKLSTLNLTLVDNLLLNQSVSREVSNNLQAYNRGVFEQLSNEGLITLVNLDDYYCNANICPIGDRNHSYYKDDNHISTFAASFASDEIRKLIQLHLK